MSTTALLDHVKVCRKCKTVYPKNGTHFYKSRHGKDGLLARCKDCMRKYYKDWTSSEKVKNRKLNQARKWQERNPEKQILIQARRNAKGRQLDFTLTIEDIVIPENCPLLGIKIVKQFGRGRADNTPSLDRVDNSKGYISGNVKVVSLLANRIKANATAEQIKTLASNIDHYVQD